MLDGVRYLLLREARQQPLLLIFDDLHWIDSETQALLDSLVEGLGSARILLLATYRPEYQHGWASKTYLQPIRLDALAGRERAANCWMRCSVRTPLWHPSSSSWSSAVTRSSWRRRFGRWWRRRHWRDDGQLSPDPTVKAVQVPATVQVMLAARIDRLSTEDKRCCKSRPSSARHVLFALLGAVADLPDEALRGALDRLQSAEFIYETGLFPDLEYSFKHALTQEVAYGGMLQDRRRDLHAGSSRQSKRFITIASASRSNCSPITPCAANYARRQCSYLFQAGVRSARHSALRNAQGSYEQALLLLSPLPDSQFKLEQSFEMRIELRAVLNVLGETRKALRHLHEAEILAETLNDERRLGRVCAMMISNNCSNADFDEALVNGTRALTIAEGVGRFGVTQHDRDQPRDVALLSGRVRTGRGDDHCQSRSNDARWPSDLRHQSPGPFSVHCWRIRSLAELGRFSETAAHAHEMLRLAEPTQGAYVVGIANLTAGWHLLAKGDWTQARPFIERGTEEYRKGDVFLALPHAVALFGPASCSNRRDQQALDLPARGRGAARAPDSGWNHRSGRHGLSLVGPRCLATRQV